MRFGVSSRIQALEGLNVKVDSRNRRLVASGPLIAAGNMQLG